MNKALTLRTIQPPNPRRTFQYIRAIAAMFLLLLTGLRGAVAANLLVDPGFEDGGGAWETNTWNTGPGQIDSTIVHSGTKSWKWNGTGATADAWQGGRQLSVPGVDTKFYQYSAWLNVPTADAGANKFGFTFRHNVGAGGVDIGYNLITAPGWTQVKGPILQLPSGMSFNYVGFHTLNYGGQTPFYLDDVAVEELDALVLNGRVVNSGGTGVADATVSAASADYTAPNTTTDASGYYTFSVPAGTYTISAGTPGFKGSTVKQVSSTPTTASDIVLAVDPDYDADLIFSAYSTSIPASGAWPTASPAGLSLTPMNSPATEVIDGVQWEKNVADGPGWRFGGEITDSIPTAGATEIAVVKPADSRVASNNWDSVIDVFYDQLVLGVRNDSGIINVRVNGSLVLAPPETALAEGQKAVISLVVQQNGTYKVYRNGTQIMENTEVGDMSVLMPGAEAYKHYINVGRNNPDGWTTFNGNIGDVFLYKVALSDTKRDELEKKLMAKFKIDPTVYTIAASVNGIGGTITPSGTVGVPAGTNKTFTIKPKTLYKIDKVIVDGVDQGPVSTYTFKNVSDNSHSIVASFQALPSQIVSGKVTGGADGVFGATVYFKTTANATVAPEFTTQTTTYDGNYAIRVPQGTWYVNATAGGYDTAADIYPVNVGGTAVTLNIPLTPQVSKMQPMLINKGTGAAVTTFSGTAGYSFTTGSVPVDVTALGFVDWDLNGLANDHDVGIWQATDLIASVTVPAGTAGNLVGDYRYVTLSPSLRLAPNTTYTIGAAIASGGDAWPNFAPNPGFNSPDFVGFWNVTGLSFEPDTFLTEPTVNRGANVVGAACNLLGKMVPASGIQGTVKDGFGVGINSAVVQIGGKTGATAVTDAHGRYKMTNVPVGASLELYSDAVGFADHTETIDTTNAATSVITKDVTLTAKLETGVVQNGGFETGLAGWSISGQQPGDTIETISPGYSGNFAGKFTPGATNSWTWFQQIINVVPGSVYNVYFKAYADPGINEWFPMVAFRNDNGDELKGWISGETGYDGWVHNPPHTWKQYLLFHTYSGDEIQPFVRIAPPEGATKIDVWVGGVAGTAFNGGSSYADDLVIDRIGPDLPNPPFTMQDAMDSLRWTSGLASLPQAYLTRFDVAADGKVDAMDTTRILRKVTGLEANP